MYDEEKLITDTSNSAILSEISRSMELIRKEKQIKQAQDTATAQGDIKLGKRDKAEGYDNYGLEEEQYQISEILRNDWKYMAKSCAKLKWIIIESVILI